MSFKPNLANLCAFFYVHFFQDHVEATGSGENATVPEGGAKSFHVQLLEILHPTSNGSRAVN